MNSGYTLDFLIESFQERECSDVLDKVYGLLGPLLSDEDFGGKIPEVNCAKTPAQLFDDVLIAVQESPRLRSPRALERFSKPLQKALALPLENVPSPNVELSEPSYGETIANHFRKSLAKTKRENELSLCLVEIFSCALMSGFSGVYVYIVCL
jgi:hypothetical protein